MDKYEYKLRLEEIKTLNRKGRFQEAAQVADSVDWKKVRNVSTLGIISDVYKVNRRFEDAKEILLLAKEQSPQNRRILYSLCDLTIKMGQVVEAVEYYKEYVQMAPNDSSKYILLYKIYEAQDISLDERIAVLKEYKKREYNEKWAYELASLYHRCGYATECVEECDQLILWFGEGKYVAKAMELKMRYVPLSPAQKQAYDRMFGRRPEQEEEPPAAEAKPQPALEPQPEVPEQDAEMDIQVKTMDMSKYNTMNLQAALAESMREVMEPEQEAYAENEEKGQPIDGRAAAANAGMRQLNAPGRAAAEEQTAYGGDNAEYQEDVDRVMRDSADWDVQATGQLEAEEQPAAGSAVTAANVRPTGDVRPTRDARPAGDVRPAGNDRPAERAAAAPEAKEKTGNGAMTEATVEKEVRSMGRGNQMNTLLQQDYDGQISMALPEERSVEKQITGQMNIQDVLAEWEKLKKKNEEKRKQETRQWMLQQTGSLFDDFDQLSREGVLEKLQREEALPPEDVQRARTGQADYLPEVEELEEIEEPAPEEETVPAAQTVARPAPANATARAVMAAQGIMEEIPIAKTQETTLEEKQQAAPQLSEIDQRRLAIEALIREAEAKQREAQALLMELERERLGLTGQQPVQAAGQNIAGAQSIAQPVTAQDTSRTGETAGQTAQVEAAAADEQQAAVQSATMQQSEAVITGQPDGLTAQQPDASAAAQPLSGRAQQPAAAEKGQQQSAKQSAEEERPADRTEDAAASVENAAADAENAAAGAEDAKDNAPVKENTQALSERIREQQLEEHERNMTRDEKELFAPFVPTKGAMRQLVKALDALSLSAYTGNMIITGAPGSDMMKMAKSVVKKMRASDRNFSGKLARISGDVLNTRNANDIVSKLPNGALIIEKGGKLSDRGASGLAKALNQEQLGIIVFLLDSKRAIAGLMERCPQLAEAFTARFDIAALDTATLVKYGCQYAYNMEYSIDELGRLALHTRIEDLQTRDHAVTVEEVREIIEEAIDHAERFSIRHFLDVLFRRRYDDDDMIILRERDFI